MKDTKINKCGCGAILVIFDDEFYNHPITNRCFNDDCLVHKSAITAWNTAHPDTSELEKALELALEYFALLDNKTRLTKSHELYSIFLHDDFSKAKWIAKAQVEIRKQAEFKDAD